MIKKLICVECPRGCELSVDVEEKQVKDIQGAACPKGSAYAISEIQNPRRILTTTVRTEGLSLKLLPVRTDKPVPKDKIFEAMDEIRKIKINTPSRPGDIVYKNLLSLGINLIGGRLASL
jgi:CxxC motif-containing protein